MPCVVCWYHVSYVCTSIHVPRNADALAGLLAGHARQGGCGTVPLQYR